MLGIEQDQQADDAFGRVHPLAVVDASDQLDPLLLADRAGRDRWWAAPADAASGGCRSPSAGTAAACGRGRLRAPSSGPGRPGRSRPGWSFVRSLRNWAVPAAVGGRFGCGSARSGWWPRSAEPPQHPPGGVVVELFAVLVVRDCSSQPGSHCSNRNRNRSTGGKIPAATSRSRRWMADRHGLNDAIPSWVRAPRRGRVRAGSGSRVAWTATGCRTGAWHAHDEVEAASARDGCVRCRRRGRR